MPKTPKTPKPIEPQVPPVEETQENYKDKWLRALADYKNLERRVEENQSQLITLANASLLRKLLPTLDLMETALKHVADPGLNLVVKQFHDALKNEYVTEIEALKQPFDSATMECIETNPGKKDYVIAVVKKGYRYKEFVLRPAQVMVGNGES